ncbi:MAG: serine/threonine protein kinase [Phycisphaerales bacterium]|nr:serine/threonine protein kinase [Phycisphaerales bacterium]
MSAIDTKNAQDILQRFLARRREGARVSIDEVMPRIDDASDRDRLRSQVIRLIVDGSRNAIIPGSSAPGATALQPEVEFPTIEGYELIDRIGRGGMGEVFEAYQSSTGRRVAVKVLLSSAVCDEPSRRRFEREVELAARLHHPNIVSVIDAGMTRGRHYCVMEYIDGQSLDQAVLAGGMSSRDALRLIATIARTVDYAHQRGVLHRDIKPSNVLIDAAGQPHLLDFGLAKAIDPRGAPADVDLTLSEPGGFLGTLGYASPEQAGGDAAEVSVRSDVYSLGAVAYAMLTGKLPVATRGPLHAVLGEIQNVDPQPPSRIARHLDADIDAILLKALEKSPSGRYAGAAALAEDIERYLRHQPIRARRIGPFGRVRRWVRRRPALAGVFAVVACALLVVSVVLVDSLNAQARREAAEATRRAAVDFVRRHLQAFSDPNQAARGGTLRGNGREIALERLDATARQIANSPDADAPLRALVMKELGRGYMQCGKYDRAAECLADASDALKKTGLAFRIDELDTEQDLALLDMAQSNFEAARDRLFALVSEFEHDSDLFNEPLRADASRNLAWALKETGDTATARKLYVWALEQHNKRNDRLAAAETLNDLAQLERNDNQFATAIDAFRQALAIRIELLGQRHTDTAATQAGLGSTLRQLEQMTEAESLLRGAFQTREQVLGRDHPDTIVSMNELGLWLHDNGQLVEAEPLLRDTLLARRAAHGDRHRRVAASLTNLGLALSAAEKHDEARACFREALDIYAARSESGMPDAIKALIHLGNLERRVARSAGADVDRAEAIERGRDAADSAARLAAGMDRASGAPLIAGSTTLDARLDLLAGDTRAARSKLASTIESLADASGMPAWRTQLAQVCLANAHLLSDDSLAAEGVLKSIHAPLSNRPDVREAVAELWRSAQERNQTALLDSITILTNDEPARNAMTK